MANYETVIIIRQDVSANQAETLVDELAKILTDAGGNIARREYWGLRQLAYRIRKNRKGHYILLNYAVDTEIKNEIERLMGINPDFLRHLTTSTEDLPTEPSVIMKERAYQEARAERGGYSARPSSGYQAQKDTPPQDGAAS
ncbi:MAG: 30S ribosomal protein S6 [Alphaproteobacteria bacterium]